MAIALPLFKPHVVAVIVATTFKSELIQGSLLMTVIVKVQVAIFPFASVALYVAVVTPIGKQPPIVKPAVGEVVNISTGVPQLSVAVGATQVATAQLSAGNNVLTVILGGQFERTGGVTSVSQGSILFMTVIVKVQNAILPLASVAL